MPEIETTGDNAHRFAPAAPDEDAVYGACCPGWHTAARHGDALSDWIEFMERRDVDRVCCLLPGRQLDASGGNVGRYRSRFGDDAVLHAPVPDHRLVDESLLEDEILPFLDATAAADESVVVHCLAGIGRTGQVLAAWLAHDRGYGAERAIATVKEMGRLPGDAVRAGNATEEELHELIGGFS
ncbi:MAG: dual specificity protein phosphatase family protein [Haloarculaceae archaeon]